MQLARLDELRILSQRLYEEVQQIETKQKKKEYLIDALYDLMVLAYVYGCNRVDDAIPQDSEKLYKALYRQIAGENFEERIARHVNEETLTEESLQRIVETDYHRMEETGAFDTAETVQERTGKTAYKVWRTMLDDRVREQHWWIEGQKVPIDQPFTTPDGSQAMFPGQFGIADQDCNCRCEVEYTFR